MVAGGTPTAGSSAAGRDGDSLEAARRPFAAGDGIRAIAALSVVLYHAAYVRSGYRAAYGHFLGSALENLDLGLYLFFVLSGYLIARPYVSAYIDGRPLPSLGSYGRNRALRIIPAFWVVTTILLLRHNLFVDVLPRGTFNASPVQLAAIFLFLQNWWPSTDAVLVGPAWTLDIEVLFYALIPLMAVVVVATLRRVPHRRRWLVVLALTFVVTASSLAARYALPATLVLQRSIPAMLFAFMLGVALASVEGRSIAAMRGHGQTLLLALSLAIVGLALLFAYYEVAPARAGFDPRGPRFRPLLAALGCGCLVGAPLVSEWSGRAGWVLLTHPVVKWVGVRSYSIYLIHQGLGVDVQALVPAWGGPITHFLFFAALLIPATLLAAALSYRFVEAPLLRLKKGPVGFGPTQLRAPLAGGC